jgi:hypothetical protein
LLFILIENIFVEVVVNHGTGWAHSLGMFPRKKDGMQVLQVYLHSPNSRILIEKFMPEKLGKK